MTTTFSVTLENEIHVTVHLSGSTWRSVTWQIDGVSYTTAGAPTVNDPVLQLVLDEMPTITVQLPDTMEDTVVPMGMAQRKSTPHRRRILQSY